METETERTMRLAGRTRYKPNPGNNGDTDLTPKRTCRMVHTPHMKRKVDMISDLTRVSSPAQT